MSEDEKDLERNDTIALLRKTVKEQEEKIRIMVEDYDRQIRELVEEVKQYKPYYEQHRLNYELKHGTELPQIQSPDSTNEKSS